jgi:hypothetical protein
MSGFFNVKTGLSEVKETEVALSLKLIELYAGRQMDWAKQALQDNEFRSGVQWDAEQVATLEARRQSATEWNLIHPAVEMQKALLTDNTPRFQATAKENSDRDFAAIVSDIMSHIWHISGGDVAIKQIVDDYSSMGRGAFLAYVDPYADYGRGEIKIKSLYPLHVYPDPDSKDPFCRDSAHILMSCLYSSEQVQAEYPQYSDRILKEGTGSSIQRNPTTHNYDVYQNRETAPNQIQKGDTDYYEVIDRYSKVIVKRFHILNTETGREDVFTKEEFELFKTRDAFRLVGADGNVEVVYTIEQVEKIAAMISASGTNVFHSIEMVTTDEMGNEVPLEPQLMPGEPGPDAVPNSRVEFMPVLYRDVMDELPFTVNEQDLTRIKRVLVIGELEVFNGIIEVDQFPVVVLNNNHTECRNPYPQSDVRKVRGLQQYYNKMKSLIMAHTANVAGIKVFVPRGSDIKAIEENFGKAGMAVVEVDMEIGQPVVAQVPPLSNQLFMELRDAEHKIQKIFGVYDMQAGDGAQAPATYKGTLAVEEYGQRRMRMKRESIEGFLNAVAAVIAQLIPQVYTHQKVIRLFQPNQKPRETEINVPLYNEYTGDVIEKTNDIASLNYDISVVSGSTLPSNRWARYEAMLQLFQLGIADDVAVLQYADVPDVQGLMERKSQMMQLASQNQALQEEIKRLTGDLQTAQRESVSDRKRVEVEQFASRLTKIEAGAQADAKVFAERAKDAIRDEKGMTQMVISAIDRKANAQEAKTKGKE